MRGENRTRGREVPELSAGGGVEGVDVSLVCEVEHAINDGGGSVPPLVVPQLCAVVRVDGKATHVHHAINDGGRPTPGRAVPQQLPVRRHRPRHRTIIASMLSVIPELHRIVLCCRRNGYSACEQYGNEKNYYRK